MRQLFIDIVIGGYQDQNNRRNLKGYFVRQFKRLEKSEFYEPWDFFIGCLDVTQTLESLIETNFYNRIKELEQIKQIRKDKGENFEEIEREIKSETKENHYAYLPNLNSEVKYIGNLSINNVIHLKEGIFKAFYQTSEKDFFEFVEKEPDKNLPQFILELKHSRKKVSEELGNLISEIDEARLNNEITLIIEINHIKNRINDFINVLPELERIDVASETRNAYKVKNEKKLVEEINTHLKTINRRLSEEAYHKCKSDIDKIIRLLQQNNIADRAEVFQEYGKLLNFRPELNEKESIAVLEDKKTKFIAKEHALAYIFDLDVEGKQIPVNRVEGSYDAKAIKKIGEGKGFDKPDTFYRAVINIDDKFNRNKINDLQNISKDWLSALKALSTNWVKTEQYLKDKDLIRD